MVAKPAAMASSRAGRVRALAWRRGLELAEGVLDGGEVGRIGWQEAHLAARCFDELADSRFLCTLRLSQSTICPGRKEGTRIWRANSGQHLPIGRPGHRHRCGDAGEAHRREERDVGAVVARHAAHHPLPPRGPAVAWRQTEIGPALIDEDQPRGSRWAVSAHHAARSASSRSLARRTFFDRDAEAADDPRHRGDTDTHPLLGSHWAQCWARVASGWTAICAANAVAWAGPMRGRRPGRGAAATEPGRALPLPPAANRAGTDAKEAGGLSRGRPASMAPSSRSRRSAEYCFMRVFFTRASALQVALTAEDQDALMAGSDAVWLSKDSPKQGQHVDARLAMLITTFSQGLADARWRTDATDPAGSQEPRDSNTGAPREGSGPQGHHDR